MARLIYSPQAKTDLDRLMRFLAEQDVASALRVLAYVEEAVGVLANHPKIGRLVESGLRELVIARGTTGYVALYSFEVLEDAVLILALRHQREAGYWTEDIL